MNVRTVFAGGDVGLFAADSILDAVDLTNPENPISADDTSTGNQQLGINVIGDSITLHAGFGIGTAENETRYRHPRRHADRVLRGHQPLSHRDHRRRAAGPARHGRFHRLPHRHRRLDQERSRRRQAEHRRQRRCQRPCAKGKAYLIASQDIGASDDFIVSSIANIISESTTGSTYVSNLGALSVGGVLQGSKPGVKAGGSVTIKASSPVTITEDVETSQDSDGDIIIIANETAQDVDGDEDFVKIKDNVKLKADRDIIIRAGDDVTIDATASLEAGRNIDIYRRRHERRPTTSIRASVRRSGSTAR